jgi:hypothetical protein
VYLGAVDLIVHEFLTSEMIRQPKKMKMIKLASVMAGFVFIMILISFFETHEGGGHEGEGEH